LDPLLLRIAVGVGGSVVGAVIAIPIASHLAATRAANSINPIEAALIGLTISVFKDIGAGLSDILKRRGERLRFIRLLGEVATDLGQQGPSGRAIPYSAIRDLSAADGVRSFVAEHELTHDLAAVELTVTTIQAYAATYDRVFPKTAAELLSQVRTLIKGLNGQGQR